jgi:hypothetical protein
MGKKGFSATTFVLVAVLIGALFMVSKSVTPPPAAPPPPVNEPTAAPPKAQPKLDPKAQKEEMQAQMKRMMKLHAGDSKRPKPAFNPDSIEVTADYWKQANMGSAGEAALREKVARAKEEQARKRVQIGAVPPVTPALMSKQAQRAAPASAPSPNGQ